MDLLNTHLESTAEHAEERTRQLEQCFEIMSKRPGDRTVIFGGDLNSRDKEVENIRIIMRRCLLMSSLLHEYQSGKRSMHIAHEKLVEWGVDKQLQK